MKKTFTSIVILLSIIVLSNCSPKTSKTVANNSPSTKSAAAASGSDLVSKAQGTRTDQEQVDFLMKLSDQRQIQGKEIYEASCVKCHKLYSPDQFNSVSWVKIMKKMGPKAHLDETQYNKVSLYLVQNAKH